MPITSDVEEAIVVVSYGCWNMTDSCTVKLAIIAMNEFRLQMFAQHFWVIIYISYVP